MNDEAKKYYELGLLSLQNQNTDTAEYCLLKSAEIEPSEISYGCLGWFYGTVNIQEDRALRFFRKAIMQNPKNGDLYNDYGALLLKIGQYNQSIKWFLKAVRLTDIDKRHYALYNLALVYRNMKRPERSLRFLRKAINQRPDFNEALNLYNNILNESK